MPRPVIGIIGNKSMLGDDYPVYASGTINIEAIGDVADCVPVVVPADPRFVSVEELMQRCDGFLLTGGRPNVHPQEYGEVATEAHGDFDRARDAIALALVRACVQSGQPFLGACRGFQEVNVAMGGSLDPEIRDLPGRMNHRMPAEGTPEEKFALRHCVRLEEGGVFHRLLGATSVMTNTLHGQGIKRPGDRIVVDGRADDGTAEAIYVSGAPGFTLAVQWHPEWNAANDPVSRALFGALGDAARAWAKGQATPLRRSA